MPYNPGTASRATTASLSTAFQADQRLRQTCAELYEYVRGIAWKAILSEAVVTEGEALGISMLNSCLEPTVTDQREVMAVPCYLVTSQLMARYCLTDSSPHASNPGTVSRCSSPSGQIASESDRFA